MMFAFMLTRHLSGSDKSSTVANARPLNFRFVFDVNSLFVANQLLVFSTSWENLHQASFGLDCVLQFSPNERCEPCDRFGLVFCPACCSWSLVSLKAAFPHPE